MKKRLLLLLFIACCGLFTITSKKLNTPTEKSVPEKPIVIIIPSYNNSKWYDWNLSSVFNQQYQNYRIVYIDDCSTDNTYELVTEKIATTGFADRCQIIRNNKNKGALANIDGACRAAHDEEIIVTLDGDDAFIDNPHVLTIINQAYQNPDVWMTFGQYQEYPEGWLGICHAIPDNVITAHAYRAYEWITSHVRTYYAWLYKRIRQEDLMFEGTYFPTTADLAIMFPLLEMSGGRFAFIDTVLYLHNQATPLNDFKIKRQQQAFFERLIRTAERYEPLLPIIINKK